MLLDFGKHRGKHIRDTPMSYIVFLAGYSLEGYRKTRCRSPACMWVREHKPEVHAYACTYLAERCWHCGGKLVPVGTSRRNGFKHDDWGGRYLHKKCWKELRYRQEDHPYFSDDSTE